MNFRVVIPARYASSRLPGKPLLDIAGKPMIQHVYERALESGASQVIVATDDSRVEKAALGFAAQVCMTSPSHHSGTDRIAEVARLQEFADDDIVVNVQGDEPLISPTLISQVAEDLKAHTDASVATLRHLINSAEEVFDPNVVKVVTDEKGYALYFSRAPIPWSRQDFDKETRQLPAGKVYYRHLGIYAYRVGFLQRYTGWQAVPMEQLEALEQLRVLAKGERIHVAEATDLPEAGVDTKADLERVRALFTS